MNNLCFHVFVLHMYASVLSFRKLLRNAAQLGYLCVLGQHCGFRDKAL